MITLYSGTPGSGKSLHLAKKIWDRLRMKRAVISNIPINLETVSEPTWSYWIRKILRKMKPRQKKIGDFQYWDFSEMTVDKLVDYAHKNHKVGREGQTLLIIDECAVMFNSRAWDHKDRMKWIVFFQTHRHLGYNVILVSQADRLIDRQIRAFIEYDCKHRALSNYGTLGWIITLIIGKSFLSIETWYGVKGVVTGREFFTLNKRKASIYNTFQMFKKDEKPAAGEPAASRGGLPADGISEGVAV